MPAERKAIAGVEFAADGVLPRKAVVVRALENLAQNEAMNVVKPVENRPATHFSVSLAPYAQPEMPAQQPPQPVQPEVSLVQTQLSPIEQAQLAVAEAFTTDDVELMG